MPYISRSKRAVIDPKINELIKLLEEKNPGQLNYIFTKILLATKPKKYEDYNALVGVLECCKLEFNRRQVALYEDTKILENGDVTI